MSQLIRLKGRIIASPTSLVKDLFTICGSKYLLVLSNLLMTLAGRGLLLCSFVLGYPLPASQSCVPPLQPANPWALHIFPFVVTDNRVLQGVPPQSGHVWSSFLRNLNHVAC